MQGSPGWCDLDQIWHSYRSHWRNDLCKVWLWSVEGWALCGCTKFTVSQWLQWLALYNRQALTWSRDLWRRSCQRIGQTTPWQLQLRHIFHCNVNYTVKSWWFESPHFSEKWWFKSPLMVFYWNWWFETLFWAFGYIMVIRITTFVKSGDSKHYIKEMVFWITTCSCKWWFEQMKIGRFECWPFESPLWWFETPLTENRSPLKHHWTDYIYIESSRVVN
jgi:hypothetical protein